MEIFMIKVEDIKLLRWFKIFFENGDTDNETLKIKKTDSDSEKVVRFLLPQEIKKYGDTKLIDFENHYFEVNVEKFNELLLLIKT